MLYYDRIGISIGIDLNKSNKGKECMICYYWFLNHGFKSQDSVCNGYHYCIIHNISKSEKINIIRKLCT